MALTPAAAAIAARHRRARRRCRGARPARGRRLPLGGSRRRTRAGTPRPRAWRSAGLAGVWSRLALRDGLWALQAVAQDVARVRRARLALDPIDRVVVELDEHE